MFYTFYIVYQIFIYFKAMHCVKPLHKSLYKRYCTNKLKLWIADLYKLFFFNFIDGFIFFQLNDRINFTISEIIGVLYVCYFEQNYLIIDHSGLHSFKAWNLISILSKSYLTICPEVSTFYTNCYLFFR